MDYLLSGVASVGLIVLSICGLIFIFADVRHFNQVAWSCDKNGYVQNNELRIICSLEKK